MLAFHTEEPSLRGRDVHSSEILGRLGNPGNCFPDLSVVAALYLVRAVKVPLAWADSGRKALQIERKNGCFSGEFHCNAFVFIPADPCAQFFHTLLCIRQFHCNQSHIVSEGWSGLGFMPQGNILIRTRHHGKSRQLNMHGTTLQIYRLPFKLLHGILGRDPGAAGAAPARSACDSHLHPQRICKTHCIAISLLPTVGEIRPLERRRLRHIHSACVELMESGYADRIHPFEILPNTFQRHFSVHPVPPDERSGSPLGLLETCNERICRRRGH